MSGSPGMSDFESRLKNDRDAINDRLDELLPGKDEPPGSLHRAMRHATLGGGKKLRGILCLETHRIFGDPCPEAALDAACAIELLHAYTLVHDDLPALDDDELRRGQPTCHVAFGEAGAILAGDALQAFAFEVLSRCDAPAASVLAAVGMLAEAAGPRFLVGGQAADIENEGKIPTGEMVEFIHTRKTAELIAVSMTLGAVLAGADEVKCSEIHSTGRMVGLAFQIVDDLLDIEGSEEAVGKGLRKDTKKGKITHPACYGVAESRAAAESLLTEAGEKVKELGDRGHLRRIFTLILRRIS
jgi:geranylgeranyl pyrophosphate synthase